MPKKWLAAGLAVLVVIAITVYARVVMWPWYVAPSADAVARAWAPVEQTAGATVTTGDRGRYDAFGDAARAARNDLGERMRTEAEHPDAPLPASIVDALAALRAWSTSPATATPLACSMAREFTLSMTLPSFARLALAAPAEAHEGAQRAADLVRLSEHLRVTGSLEDYLVGAKILDAVVRWAEPRGPAPAFLVATRADVHELEAAIARHLVCMDRFLGNARQASYDGEGVYPRPWFARRYVRLDRERDVYRLYGADIVAHCHPLVDDAVAYVACTNEGPIELPKSAAVRSLPFVPLTGIVPILARYDAVTRR